MPKTAKPPEKKWVVTALRLHPEIKRLLKSEAALEDKDMQEKLHEILCQGFGREDLINQTSC